MLLIITGLYLKYPDRPMIVNQPESTFACSQRLLCMRQLFRISATLYIVV